MHKGLIEYHHGNDCGWDNSTVFAAEPAVKSPDSIAFLVLQAETLAKVADLIEMHNRAEYWTQMSQTFLSNLDML